MKEAGWGKLDVDHERRRLLRDVLQRVQAKPSRRYRPEKHYMRGPGPKTLAKLGELLRAETDDVTREPVPERCLDLIQAMGTGKRNG
jgi:hypothetical protein